MRSFASDNNSGIHPAILKAIQDCNTDHTVGYGDDVYTKRAIELFRQHFGQHTEVFFVFNGTASNTLGLMHATKTFNSVICADTSHVNTDECGAPERIAGIKLIPVPNRNGKIKPADIMPHLEGFGFEHHSQPGAISITQSTEMGTVYKPEEIKELADLAHQNSMLLHIDGSRLANAAVALGLPFKNFTSDCGVDIVSFGGTKNGMMMGEAILFLNQKLAKDFKYIRKQNMQLFSKMRFISAQFIAWFEDELWKKNAQHANSMAQKLAKEIQTIPQIKITVPVEVNGVFAEIPQHWIEPLKKEFFFYTWNHLRNEVRWMCSFDTTDKDIEQFIGLLKKFSHSE